MDCLIYKPIDKVGKWEYNAAIPIEKTKGGKHNDVYDVLLYVFQI